MRKRCAYRGGQCDNHPEYFLIYLFRDGNGLSVCQGFFCPLHLGSAIADVRQRSDVRWWCYGEIVHFVFEEPRRSSLDPTAISEAAAEGIGRSFGIWARNLWPGVIFAILLGLLVRWTQ